MPSQAFSRDLRSHRDIGECPMTKLLQYVRDWTASPDTDGVATAVFNAWQSPEAKKADVETASLHECH